MTAEGSGLHWRALLPIYFLWFELPLNCNVRSFSQSNLLLLWSTLLQLLSFLVVLLDYWLFVCSRITLGRNAMISAGTAIFLLGSTGPLWSCFVDLTFMCSRVVFVKVARGFLVCSFVCFC